VSQRKHRPTSLRAFFDAGAPQALSSEQVPLKHGAESAKGDVRRLGISDAASGARLKCRKVGESASEGNRSETRKAPRKAQIVPVSPHTYIGGRPMQKCCGSKRTCSDACAPPGYALALAARGRAEANKTRLTCFAEAAKTLTESKQAAPYRDTSGCAPAHGPYAIKPRRQPLRTSPLLPAACPWPPGSKQSTSATSPRPK